MKRNWRWGQRGRLKSLRGSCSTCARPSARMVFSRRSSRPLCRARVSGSSRRLSRRLLRRRGRLSRKPAPVPAKRSPTLFRHFFPVSGCSSRPPGSRFRISCTQRTCRSFSKRWTFTRTRCSSKGARTTSARSGSKKWTGCRQRKTSAISAIFRFSAARARRVTARNLATSLKTR